ncbi:hypothetical protein GCM10029964_024980 [Kibdelosporangium lantanae]
MGEGFVAGCGQLARASGEASDVDLNPVVGVGTMAACVLGPPDSVEYRQEVPGGLGRGVTLGRTAHHRARSRTRSFPRATTDLRYSAACLADTTGRPRPSYFRRTVHIRSHSRLQYATVADWVRVGERAARQRLRRELTAIRKLRDRADVDVTPYRHRRNGRWLA